MHTIEVLEFSLEYFLLLHISTPRHSGGKYCTFDSNRFDDLEHSSVEKLLIETCNQSDSVYGWDIDRDHKVETTDREAAVSAPNKDIFLNQFILLAIGSKNHTNFNKWKKR